MMIKLLKPTIRVETLTGRAAVDEKPTLSRPRPTTAVRAKPGFCVGCGREPWPCPICGDYRCACVNPYSILMTKKKDKMVIAVHYGRDGRPYPPQFVDGFWPESYANDLDVRDLMET